MHSLIRKLHTAAQLSWQQLLWLVPLYMMSGLIRLAILVLPFRWITPILGQHNQTTELTVLASDEQEMRASQIAVVIKIISKYTPWESRCLVQAILARAVLSFHKIPHITYLGVTKSEEEDEALKAHAWVSSGRCFVTGGNSHHRYTVVSGFIHDSRINQQPTTHAN